MEKSSFCVVITTAFVMGINVQDIRQVIHWGYSHTFFIIHAID